MPKPGYKTTEFWVTVVIAVLGILGASGVVGEGTQTETIIGYVAALLAALGYTGVRGSLKKIEAVKNAPSDSGSDS